VEMEKVKVQEGISGLSKKPKIIATEITEDSEGKYLVPSGYSGAKIILYIQ